MTWLKLTEHEVYALIKMVDFARHNSEITEFRNECSALTNKIKNQAMNSLRLRQTQLAMHKNGI